ncbi:MAG: hypothetical protein WKF59_23400 [Chitinophagaceae bacterium]
MQVSKKSAANYNFGGLTELYTLSAFGAYGVIFKTKDGDHYFAGYSVPISQEAQRNISKFLTHRTRPSFYGNGVDAEPKFFGSIF